MQTDETIKPPSKPPEEYKILKIPLKNILNSKNSDQMKNNLHAIEDACYRTNEIIIHTYQFLRLFVIKTNQNDDDNFIKINGDVVLMAMKIFIKEKKQGRSIVGENKKIYDIFNQFYEKEYRDLYDGKKIDGTNLSGILHYIQTEIVTAIENNVKTHFVSYINRFVNCSFKDEHNKLLETLKGNEKDKLKVQLKAELKLIKDDLINLTQTRDPKYNCWFDNWRYKILPFLSADYNKDYICYLKNHPQEFISCMRRMSAQIIKMGYNSFQFFPLRKECVPKYISIDNKTLIDLLINDGTSKNTYFSNINKYKRRLWSTIFNMNNKIFKYNDHEFDYRILTNGLTASIQFIHKKYVSKKNTKKENIKKGQEKSNEEYKNLERNEIDILKNNKKQKKEDFKIKKNEKIHDAKKEFKKKDTIEKEKIVKEIKEKKHIEFPYLEELKDDKLNDLKDDKSEGKVIYVDPGKKNLLYMVNDNDVYFRYSNRERIVETKRLEYQCKIQKYKNENGINAIEQKLVNFNSKSCDADEFKKYIKKKNEVNIMLKEKYKEEIFRKYKWYSFMNTKRSEDNLLKKIEKVYGTDITMIYGDWSIGKQMRNFISTPNISLKKKLATRFKIYSIDEFKTSKVNYKTGEVTKNLYLPDRTGTLRKKHSILTYKTENGRTGCINRDKSAVNGMKLITEYFLKTGKRLEMYKREKKKPIKKAINLEAPLESNKKPLKVYKNKKSTLNKKEKNLLVSNVSKSPKGTFNVC